jgi:serine/threonine protein kinase
MPSVGSIIAGKYELVRRLGSGSMGEVWVAHHCTLDEDVALKLLSTSPTTGEVEDASTAAARFRFEAQVAARLSRRTRHIVQVTDYGGDDGLAYLVMELLEGETLERRLMRRGCLPVADALALVAQVGRALTEAHAAEVIHRDLKPANVFLTQDEDGALLVKLLDFGIARTVHTHRVPAPFSTAHGLVFGTPGYMSPEQASPSTKLDHRCDLWALATIAYEVLTGELPVAGAFTEELLANLCSGRIVPVHERDPTLPDALAGFFARAFAPRPVDRFASAAELARAFEEAVTAPGAETQHPAASTLKGQTLPITFRMRFRPRTDAEASSEGVRAFPRIVFIAPAAALFGLSAMGVAWCTATHPMARSPTMGATAPAMTFSGSIGVSAIQPVVELSSPVGDPDALQSSPEPTTTAAVSAPAPPSRMARLLSAPLPAPPASASAAPPPVAAAVTESPVAPEITTERDPAPAVPSSTARPVGQKRPHKSEVF